MNENLDQELFKYYKLSFHKKIFNNLDWFLDKNAPKEISQEVIDQLEEYEQAMLDMFDHAQFTELDEDNLTILRNNLDPKKKLSNCESQAKEGEAGEGNKTITLRKREVKSLRKGQGRE